MVCLTSLLAATASLYSLTAAQINGVCNDAISSSSNPLSNRKNYVTGTANGTTIVLPIQYSVARNLIPAQYPILKDAYQAWLPTLGANQYPMVLQMDLMHDLYDHGKREGKDGDFLHAALTFPFVDRLNDGHTSFAYQHDAIISTSNTAAQTAWGLNGINIHPGFFSACNGYEYDNGTETLPPAQRRIDQAAWTNTNPDLGNPDLAYRMTPTGGDSPYSNEFFLNVTSQPLFGDKKGCDQRVQRLDTRVSKGAFAPVPLEGDVAAMQSMFPVRAKTTWSGVHGLKADFAWRESRNVACTSLKGFGVVNAS